MKYIKYISILLIGLFILSSLIPSVNAEPDQDTILDKLLKRIYKWGQGALVPVPWKFFRVTQPEVFVSEPNTIDVEYLSQSEMYIGIKNPDTGEWENRATYEANILFESTDYEFSLEIPDYIPDGVFKVVFDPPMIVIGEEGEMKTKLTLFTNIPKNLVLPDNIVLRINISRYYTAGNLLIPSSTLIKERGLSMAIFITISAWGINGGLAPWGIWYSGKRSLDEEFLYIDLLVNVNRFHLADMTNPPQYIEMRPNEVTTIPIEIQNLGSHIDTFNFNITTKSNSDIIVSQPCALTLEPGEIGYTSIGIASPRYFQDPGTVHSIDIQAYSIYQPEKVFTNTITVTTRGVYISELNTSFFIFLSFIIIFGAGFLLYRRKRKLDKILMKPDKPWDIPEEKEYLKELKEKDKKKYKETLAMMDQEYQSSILWYNSYIISVLYKPEIKKQKPKLKESKFTRSIKNLAFKPKKSRKLEKKEKIKAKEKEEKKENKITTAIGKLSLKPKETKKFEIEKEQIEEPKLSEAEIEEAISERKKKDALLKTRRLQEKQRRKYRSVL